MGGSNRCVVLEEVVGSFAAAERPDVTIGVGRPQSDAEGFRITHRQAMAAHGLALTTRVPALGHERIALDHLAGGDSALAGQFIRDELGRIRDDRLVRTLRVYLDAGQNGTRAATNLGVSARTVSHRLRSIENQLGHEVAMRAAELHVALRLRDLVDRSRHRSSER